MFDFTLLDLFCQLDLIAFHYLDSHGLIHQLVSFGTHVANVLLEIRRVEIPIQGLQKPCQPARLLFAANPVPMHDASARGHVGYDPPPAPVLLFIFLVDRKLPEREVGENRDHFEIAFVVVTKDADLDALHVLILSY